MSAIFTPDAQSPGSSGPIVQTSAGELANVNPADLLASALAIDAADGPGSQPTFLQPGGATSGPGQVVPDRNDLAIQNQFIGAGSGPLDPVPFRYTPDDVTATFASMSPARRLQVQRQMVNAGLMDASFRDQELDRNTRGALRQVLAWANFTGTHWTQALSGMEERWQTAKARQEDEELKEARKAFVQPAYIAPDYAELAQAAKSVASQHLDRDLKEYEVELLADELSNYSRKAYEAEVAAMRAEHGAAVDASITNEDQASGEVQGVNPVAKFKEAFEERYSGEIQAEEDEDAAAQSKQALNQVGGRLKAMFGGGARSI